MATSHNATHSMSLKSVLHALTADRTKPEKMRLSPRDLTNVLNMLCTLLENGMPLQKALTALSGDSSLKKQRKLLRLLQHRMTEGSAFHTAIARFPNAFPTTVVQQIKLGETSGNLVGSLHRIIVQIEGWIALRNSLMQKMSYPALVILAGSGLMTFMLTTVVPQFETIYSESKVDLPWVTTVVTQLSRTLGRHLWLPLVPIIAAAAVWFQVRTSATARRRFDYVMTRIPIIGAFVRDIAVLQFLRGVHALCESGFVPIDAITQACSTVSNRHVQSQLKKMAGLLVHGTKLSSAMNDLDHLIPSAVRQLITVGEHSGNITKACEGSCDFIHKRLQRRINGAMAMIEPILTVGLAACIGWIVLAMYMPMFKMFDVLDY